MYLQRMLESPNEWKFDSFLRVKIYFGLGRPY